MQEARSKFSVESEPENAIVIDQLDGYLSPEGSAKIHFRRTSPSASMGRINCKVCLIFCCKPFWLEKKSQFEPFQFNFK